MEEQTHIAIVEDNKKYNDVLTAIFNAEKGFKCLINCDSAECFFSILESRKLTIDVILLDIVLPKMSGIEAIDLIKKKCPNTKILILSQFDDDDMIFNAMSKGANGYLLKSSSLIDIIKSVRNIKNDITIMSPYIASRIVKMFQDLTQPKKEYKLTHQEKNILLEVTSGLSKKMIAEKLFISFHTVDSHIRNIYRKLNVNTQVALVTKTLREKII